MPDTSNKNPVVPESKVVSKKRTGFSLIWLIPLFAAAVGAWVAINTIRNQGPEITIVFKSADGLEAGKTKIRYNGVEIGEIHSIRLADDYQTVIATAKMHPKTDEFLRKDTKFWVVRPQISGANVSGLSTLISGAYIGMEIGTAKESERHFTALPEAPLETAGVTGKFFNLKTANAGSIASGTPVFYRRIQVGQVAACDLDKDGKFLNVKIFVQSPYDKYVSPDTRFWNASGFNLSLSASGLEMHTESFLSILVGGIAFETPADAVANGPSAEGATFDLWRNREEAFRPPPVNPREYVLLFKESLRGLTVGAPVELNGITIGEVINIRARFDVDTAEFVAPVTIRTDMARYGVDLINVADEKDSSDLAAHHRHALDLLIQRGLRAQLKNGSLLTGARYISIEFHPDAPPAVVDWTQSPVQLPTLPGKLASIESGVADVVTKLNQVPFKSIGDNLNKTIVELQSTATNASILLNNAGKLVAPGSALDAQLNTTLQQVGGAAQALRILADYLERHPEAILHGKPGDAQP